MREKSEKYNEIENGYRDEKIVLRSRELDSNISNHRKASSKSASCEKNIATRLVMGSDDKLEKFKEYTPGKQKLRTFCTQFPKSNAQNPKGRQNGPNSGQNYYHYESKNSSDKLNGWNQFISNVYFRWLLAYDEDFYNRNISSKVLLNLVPGKFKPLRNHHQATSLHLNWLKCRN